MEESAADFWPMAKCLRLFPAMDSRAAMVFALGGN